jgi:hypothetical protein
MKRVFLILSLAISASCYSQNVKQDASGNYIAVSAQRDSATATPTGKTFTDSKGISYPVYMTAKGKLFVMRTSKNTGKQYKYYLKVN